MEAMNNFFTPVTGIIGGTLIGLSAASLLLFNGDILGASGVMSSIFTNPQKALSDPSQYWKLVLLASFVVTSATLLGPDFHEDLRAENDPSVPIASPFAYTLAGLLVGFGTSLGNGCTSGHGVCGLGRLSPRSFAAVATFLTTAIATVTLIAPESPFAHYTSFLRTDKPAPLDVSLGAHFTSLVTLIAIMASPFMSKKAFASVDKSKLLPAALAGSLFASGLAISQMVLGSKLFGFLHVVSIADGTWDATLATVLGSAVGVSFLSYQYVTGFGVIKNAKALATPFSAPRFSVPTNRTIDVNLISGAAIFGIGWAIALLCPGPALFQAAVGNPNVLFRWIPAFVAGSMTAQRIRR